MHSKKYKPTMDIASNQDLSVSVEKFIDGLFRDKEYGYYHRRATGNINGEQYYPEILRLR
ncbi:MAG: hypothetical protein OEM28_01665 [Nitrosopumilus sp.]|nr:hypothetical protein [Nitrosopumilus sp.]MDH3487785.1 hypothetical protein [Nitrosopumilus sp.]